METISLIISIISLIVSLVALFALWGNISNFCYNYKHFKEGGMRITYLSGEYRVFEGYEEKVLLYQSSPDPDQYVVYRENGKIEMREEIPHFKKWTTSRKFHDIRVPYYPIRLL
jgi:hypothetical protein